MKHLKAWIKFALIIISCLWCYFFIRYGYTIVLKTNVDKVAVFHKTVNIDDINLEIKADVPSTEKYDKFDNISAFWAHGECYKFPLTDHYVSVTDQIWLPVDSVKTLYVFSAYSINQRAYTIGARLRSERSARCQVWYHQMNSTILTMKEEIVSISMALEGDGERYSSTIFECPLRRDMGTPMFVSVVKNACDKPLNLLRIQNASIPAYYTSKFTVCLSPLFYDFRNAYELVEWIELNRILGADRFVIYNHSVSENVRKVFNYYIKQDLMEVVNWKLPMRVKTYPTENVGMEIHYFGQTAALNDCLFRSKQKSTFVVNVDLDEFIIPHTNDTKTWSELIKRFPETSDVYLFRSSYFRKEFMSSNKSALFPEINLANRFKLITLQILEREPMVFPPRQRSKYIARTGTVNEMLTHEVHRVKTENVQPEIGLVHHYRNWSNYQDGKDRVFDATVMKKYGPELINRVQTMWDIFSGIDMF